MSKIIKYVIIDILRNRIVIAYTIALLALSMSIFNLEDSPAKGMLSLLNIVLIIVPMVSILFASIYMYNSAEFLELLVSQPLKRRLIWLSLFAGISASLLLSLLVGIGIPVLLYAANATGFMLLACGLFLTLIFVAIALLATVRIRDKARGIGAAILLWLYFALLFDGVVLFILFQFSDYPLEKPLMAISAFNPIDLSRIMVLLKMDVSVMMGYTGAVFKKVFGTSIGMMITVFIMILWVVLPAWLSVRRFNRKDL